MRDSTPPTPLLCPRHPRVWTRWCDTLAVHHHHHHSAPHGPLGAGQIACDVKCLQSLCLRELGCAMLCRIAPLLHPWHPRGWTRWCSPRLRIVTITTQHQTLRLHGTKVRSLMGRAHCMASTTFALRIWSTTQHYWVSVPCLWTPLRCSRVKVRGDRWSIPSTLSLAWDPEMVVARVQPKELGNYKCCLLMLSARVTTGFFPTFRTL